MADSEEVPFQLSEHATVTLRERAIELRWIAEALRNPSRIEVDRHDAAIRHAILPIPDFGNRVLRVVYNPSMKPPLIVTAFFDRSLKGTL